jgi:hypothetical protein
VFAIIDTASKTRTENDGTERALSVSGYVY